MHVLHLKQRTVLKGFLTILLVCLWVLSSTSNVSAQANINFNNISGTQLLESLKNKQISPAQASSLLSNQGKLPLGEASNLLQQLQSGKFNVGDAGKLLDGALGGQGVLNAGNIGDAMKMVQGLQNGNASPAAIADLLGKVGDGFVPPEIGKALGQIQNLGNLMNAQSLGDVFKNPIVAKGLESILKQSGIQAEAIGAIQDIAEMAANPAGLQGAAQQMAAQAITQALQQVAPELVKALGGAEGLAGILGSILGTGGQQGTEEQLKSIVDNNGPSCGAKCKACSECAPKINTNHRRIRAHTTSEFEQHRNWIVTTYFLENILPSMMLMTESFVTNMVQQVQIIGTFFDAKHQLETQRMFQTMTAQAHKDYHPSESMCTIGTNVRSLASSERRANLSHVAFANRMMQRQLLNGDTVSTEGEDNDRKARINTFVEKFCDKTAHGGGLSKLCEDSKPKPEQINMDVDFTTAFENKLTLDVNFNSDGNNGTPTTDEENLFALSANLFANKVLPSVSDILLANRDNEVHDLANYYLDLRAIAAKRSIAQNSFAAITALKTEGDDQVAPFLKSILQEAGIAPEDIEERLGEKPSYFAQMEVITKDMYQNPTFYANLYDKPVNVERKAAALQAIELMQDRDIYKSLLRSEAVLATLIETLLASEHRRISRDLSSIDAASSTYDTD